MKYDSTYFYSIYQLTCLVELDLLENRYVYLDQEWFKITLIIYK